MTTFKSLTTIKQETEKKRYYRPFDYARMVALTKFIEELEQEPSFKLVTANPCIAHLRSSNVEEHMKVEETAKFVIGLWCKFEVNDTQYYIQINENPFFEAYVSSSIVNHEKKTIKTTALCKVNDILYKNIEWTNTEENINKFVENLKELIPYINMIHMNRTEKYLSYRDKNEQTIYTH